MKAKFLTEKILVPDRNTLANCRGNKRENQVDRFYRRIKKTEEKMKIKKGTVILNHFLP